MYDGNNIPVVRKLRSLGRVPVLFTELGQEILVRLGVPPPRSGWTRTSHGGGLFANKLGELMNPHPQPSLDRVIDGQIAPGRWAANIYTQGDFNSENGKQRTRGKLPAELTLITTSTCRALFFHRPCPYVRQARPPAQFHYLCFYLWHLPPPWQDMPPPSNRATSGVHPRKIRARQDTTLN